MTMCVKDLAAVVDEGFDQLQPALWSKNTALMAAVASAIQGLDQGTLQVVTRGGDDWMVQAWLKKAILIYLKTQACQQMGQGHHQAFDKIPLKYDNYSLAQWQAQGVRVVPPATVRYGAFVGCDAVLMPSYINIGAHVGEGTMIDTWATVGSCAYIGKRVHISGGAGIGGVLEPLQANPTIIEDHCFIGARSEIVEGVVVEEGAVIGMGVMLSQSTKIYDRATGKVSYGRIPKNAVVVPGAMPSQDGTHQLHCAVIVKYADLVTRAKTGINVLLRDEV